MTGFIDTLYTHDSGVQVIERYRWSTHFTVHHCRHTRVLSLHYSYPVNRFITLSLQLQITHEVFFSQPNSFRVISSQSFSTAISRTRPNSRQLLLSNQKSKSKLYYDGQSVGQHVLVSSTHFYYCQTVACLLIWDALSDERTGLPFTVAVTIFYCLRFDTPQTWRASSPYLYPPGTGSLKPHS
jgi:hypothetical protein